MMPYIKCLSQGNTGFPLTYLELLCHSALLSGIHLGQHNLGLLLGENAGGLGVLRGQS